MSRIKWEADQIESLAGVFVRLRIKNPFASVNNLLTKAQEETLVPDQRRNVGSINQIPLLVERIKALMIVATNAEPPPPTIIEIPVEAPVDFLELSRRLDLPSLMSLVTEKVSQSLAGFALANNNHAPQPTATTKAVPVSLFVQKPVEKPRPPRVLFACMDNHLFQKIKDEVERLKIEVELRGWDIDRNATSITVQADYVMFPKKALGGIAMHTARSQYPEKRVKILADNTPESAIKCLYDILSLKTTIPARITTLNRVSP